MGLVPMVNSNSKSQTFFYVFPGGSSKPNPRGLFYTGKKDLKGVDEYQFSKGNLIHDWPADIMFEVEGKHLEDYLVVGLQWMVVSDRVKKVFDKCQIKGIQFLPVQIILKNTGKEIGPYWAWNVYQEVDALDWDKTTWLPSVTDPHAEKYPETKILRESLRASVLRDTDIFRLNIKGEGGSAVFVSSRLKNCLEAAGATIGFEFKPIVAS